MRQLLAPVAVLAVLCGGGRAIAQTLPTTQSGLLQIIIEDVKPGHDADHAKTEAGWPAAFEKANSPYYGLGMVAVTGRPEAWFVNPFDSNKALGDSMKRSSDDPVLAAELARLSRADAEHLTGIRTIMAAARKDLSFGKFPDVARQRFWSITTFRVKPGHEMEFEAAAKAYGAATGRAAPDTSYRVYEVTAGVSASTYLVFSSVVAFADFDQAQAGGESIMKGATKDEMATLQKFSAEGLINTETQQFRLEPAMSYVPKEVRAQDPAFWMPKKPMVKKAATNQQ
ncbi:MAG TPA: hypothetical protein VL309_08620 [Vicinamibacterales bacterium]|jgi:hypothetical protein|nr:hypothetical protein [Vicinamibacterales bacterium]